MNNREVIIWGTIGCIIALLICWLGGCIFSLETEETTHTYGIFGFPIKGKTLAALLLWLGFVFLFYCIRKMVKYLSQKASS